MQHDIDRKFPVRIRFFILLFALVAGQSCSGIPVKPQVSPDPQRIGDILENINQQNNMVMTFYSRGRLAVHGKDGDFEADILFIGSQKPFILKIEVSHSWGRPIFHILINETDIQIISFPDNKWYHSKISHNNLHGFFPMHLDPYQIWSFGRGFPFLNTYDHAGQNNGNNIILIKRNGETEQTIKINSENTASFKVSMLKKGVDLIFMKIMTQERIQYATRNKIIDHATNTVLELEIKKAAFNRSFDPAIFDLDVPSDFEEIRGDGILDTP